MKRILIAVLLLGSVSVIAQKKNKLDPAIQQINANKETALAALNNAYEADKKTALQIWEFAEVGHKLLAQKKIQSQVKMLDMVVVTIYLEPLLLALGLL